MFIHQQEEFDIWDNLCGNISSECMEPCMLDDFYLISHISFTICM
jgi:hypothetical protein